MTTPLDKHTLCFIEYVIKIKDEKSSLSERHITYHPLLLNLNNKLLQSQISDLLCKFMNGTESDPNQESPEITIKVKMVWQT